MLHIKVRSMTRKKKKDDRPKDKISETVAEEKPLSKSALAMRKHREKMKSDTEQYAAYLAKEKIRSQERRNAKTAIQKKRDAETAKFRMRDFRSKAAAKQADVNDGASTSGNSTPASTSGNPPTAVSTRSMEQKKAEKREYNRLKQRESRANRSAQKARRAREKNAARMRETRQFEKDLRDGVKKDFEENEKRKQVRRSTGVQSEAAGRMEVSRHRARMPNTPRRFANIVTGILKSATPKKKAALRALGGNIFQDERPSSPRKLFQCLKAVKKDMRKGKQFNPRRAFINSVVKQVKARYDVSKRKLRNYMGLMTSDIQAADSPMGLQLARKSRSDKISDKQEEEVVNFYQRPDNCTELPDKKAVSAKTKSAARIAQKSIQGPYGKWKQENPNCKMGFTKFSQMRMKARVKTQNKMPHYQCLCEYCANIDLKLKAVRQIAAKQKQEELLIATKDRYALVNATLCPRDDQYHKIECIDRDCCMCGVKSLKDLLEVLDWTQTTSWNIWTYKDSEFTKNKKRRVIMRKTGTFEELVNELSDELVPFARHLFNAQWQHHRFRDITASIPSYTAILVMDFSENFTTFAQHEIQSAHWCKQQVTLHPIVAYYSCPQHGKTIQEAIHIVSDDITHDAHAVAAFVNVATKHLMEVRGLDLRRQIQFTDGCSSQYKSKTPFMDISYGQHDHNMTVERHFFGSRHGKGPSDGEGGIVKSAATRAIKSEQALITDAQAFHLFGEEHLTKPQHDGEECRNPRVFYYVSKAMINRERPERDAKTVKGTRQFHAVRGVDKGCIETRDLSCFCSNCEEGRDNCVNLDYITPYKKVQMKFTMHDEGAQDDQETEDLHDMQDNGAADGEDDTAYGEDDTTDRDEQPVEETSTDPESKRDISTGQFVAVKFNQTKRNGDNTAIIYMAVVTDIVEDDQLTVKFMRKVDRGLSGGDESFFIFEENIFTHPRSDIVCSVHPPSLRNARNHFIFSQDDLNKVANAVGCKFVLK